MYLKKECVNEWRSGLAGGVGLKATVGSKTEKF
jgi:hypothetical protein